MHSYAVNTTIQAETTLVHSSKFDTFEFHNFL